MQAEISWQESDGQQWTSQPGTAQQLSAHEYEGRWHSGSLCVCHSVDFVQRHTRSWRVLLPHCLSAVLVTAVHPIR